MAELCFDVVLVDCGPNQSYDRKSLENRPLGGVESSTIRLAEGLGSMGLAVAVVKASDPELGIEVMQFEPTYGQHAFYMHEKELSRMDARHAIFLRGPKYISYFPTASKYVWCHDLASPSISEWVPLLKEYNATVVAVSKWHQNQIRTYLEYDRTTFAYNPVPEDIYLDRDKTRTKVNKDLMVWASSPHKGLDEALGIFKKIHEYLPNMKLLVYNPGYLKGEVVINPGVLYYGPTPSKNVWHNLRNALCLFYPSDFQETFGLVAAEANALGTPMVGYKSGALEEVVQDDRQLLEIGDEAGVIERVLYFHKSKPKTVYGRDEFRLTNVVMSWLKIFAGRL